MLFVQGALDRKARLWDYISGDPIGPYYFGEFVLCGQWVTQAYAQNGRLVLYDVPQADSRSVEVINSEVERQIGPRVSSNGK